MIRRLFWLTLGAAVGISGYRRATALVRSISPGPRARELTRFAGDVREGMELYRQQQPGRGSPTLEGQRTNNGRTNQIEDGR
jgi:hypothetical protein